MMSDTLDYPCDETLSDEEELQLQQQKGSITGFFEAKSTSLKKRIMEWPEELT